MKLLGLAAITALGFALLVVAVRAQPEQPRDVAVVDRWLRDTRLEESERERMRWLAEPRLAGG